jgi:hypothetical protein
VDYKEVEFAFQGEIWFAQNLADFIRRANRRYHPVRY